MLKNRFFTAFAFAGLLGLTACGGEEAEVVEEPVVEEPAPIVEPAPVVVDPAAPVVTDTAAVGAVPADTAM